MSLMVQVQFERNNGTSKTGKLVWVDASWNLKRGQIVSFEGEAVDMLWMVKKVYTTQIPAANLHAKWGLDLPKSQRTER